MKPLSHSAITLYLDCPLRYKLVYVDGLETEEKFYFSFGSTLHKALAFFYDVGVPHPPSLEELLNFYQDNWEKGGYENEEQEKEYFGYGKQILIEFFNKHIKDYRLPLAVERRFNFKVDEIPVTGYIDRLEKLPSGRVEIVDYKSGKGLFELNQLRKDSQLSMYQMGVEEAFGLEVERLTLYHLRSQTPFSIGHHSSEQIEIMRRRIVEVAEGIQKQEFDPKRGSYCPCEFPQFCPYYRHQYLTEEEKKVKAFPDVRIEEVVEQYGELKTKYKELDLREQELREILVKYFEEKGLREVCRGNQRIYQLIMEKDEYDEREVRKILEPEGLWEKVISLNGKMLGELLKGPNVPLDVKKRLDAIKSVKRILQIRYSKVKDTERKI
ncbi:MAG: RecB family exonuclease [Candidatus Lokiarchaeia archaeon]